MAARRGRIFDPESAESFRISRSKVDLFLKCPRCFYLDRRLGIGQPAGPPFSLNVAVDELLKKEFDSYRAAGEPHPLMRMNGIDAVPFRHERLDEWRDALHRGVTAPLPGTPLIITGGIDDVWVGPSGELFVVDYKATAKDGTVSLDAEWQIAYKRQVEIYQWLLRRNGFTVSDTSYFVYCNGAKRAEAFNARLDFSIRVIPYRGSTEWVEPTLKELYECLRSPNLPANTSDCEHCRYRKKAAAVEEWSAETGQQVDTSED